MPDFYIIKPQNVDWSQFIRLIELTYFSICFSSMNQSAPPKIQIIDNSELEFKTGLGPAIALDAGIIYNFDGWKTLPCYELETSPLWHKIEIIKSDCDSKSMYLRGIQSKSIELSDWQSHLLVKKGRAGYDDLYEGWKTKLATLKNKIWLYNTQKFSRSENSNQGECSSLISLCAGFAELEILEKYGASASTNIFLYDYSSNAVKWKEFLYHAWDGFNFPEFLQTDRVAGFKSFFRKVELSDFEYWVEKEWQELLDLWGGQSSFQKSWKRGRGLSKSYHHLDIRSSQFYEFINNLSATGSTVWWSANCFILEEANAVHSVAQQQAQFIKLLSLISEKKDPWVYLGHTPWGPYLEKQIIKADVQEFKALKLNDASFA